jgi:hypothetical protein
MVSLLSLAGRAALQSSAVLLALLCISARAEAQRRSVEPFREFIGSWSGAGTISLANGSSEPIRCQAVYANGTDASNLRSTVRCASDSYKFELNSDVSYQAGTLSGNWREASRNISGSLTGSAEPGQITARIDAPGFAAGLALAARGKQQSVTLRSQGTELTGMSINLTRR